MKLMKKLIFIFFALAVFAPISICAQSAAVNKAWAPFWTKFSTAVKGKDRAAVKGLMASESEFFPGSGNTGRDDWLDMLRDSNMWKDVQKSVAKGVVNYSEGGKPGRITRDRNLIFQFLHSQWRFVGVMGD